MTRVLPRVVIEYDEYERPGLVHAVRYARSISAEVGCSYQTMCGEMLFSDAKKPSRRRGMPGCVRCVLVLVEEAVCL